MQLVVSNKQEAVPVGDDLISLLERLLGNLLREEGYPESAEVSLVFVDDEEMAHLNAQYRGVPRPTDVLAFPMFEPGELEEARRAEGELLLGDIVIATPRARAQAQEYGHSFAREVAFLAVHGLLHLLGYDHEQPEQEAVMREKEQRALALLGEERVDA